MSFFRLAAAFSSIGTAIIPPPEPKKPLHIPTAIPVSALKHFLFTRKKITPYYYLYGVMIYSLNYQSISTIIF